MKSQILARRPANPRALIIETDGIQRRRKRVRGLGPIHRAGHRARGILLMHNAGKRFCHGRPVGARELLAHLVADAPENHRWTIPIPPQLGP